MLTRFGWTGIVAAALAMFTLAMVMGAAMDGGRIITPRGVVEGSKSPVPPGVRLHERNAANPWDDDGTQLPGHSGALVSRVRIIQWDHSVARFDSSTGSIHRFNGDLDKPNVRAQWVPLVRGVNERTSGVLQIQQPHGVHAIDAAFLVDVITGDTWILRRRGANATWEKVEVFR